MDLSPHLARTIAFRTVRKGYDPEEVDAFRERAASAIESAQNQATAMEARARAAVSKLQEATQQATERDGERDGDPSPAGSPTPARAAAPRLATEVTHTTTDAETISKTLLLAQRTAETTVAEANTAAAAAVADAETTAKSLIDQAKAESSRLVDEARLEARRAAEGERVSVANEVQALLARRDFLLSDVEHLEQHLANERQRVRGAAESLLDVIERSSAGLADGRRPLLSASADDQHGRDEALSDGLMASEETSVDAPLDAPTDTVFDGSRDDFPQAARAAADAVSEPTPVHTELSIDFGERDDTEH